MKGDKDIFLFPYKANYFLIIFKNLKTALVF